MKDSSVDFYFTREKSEFSLMSRADVSEKVDYSIGEKIKSAKRLPFLKNNFKSKQKFAEIYNGPHENKVKILRQLSSVFCFLLQPLFER